MSIEAMKQALETEHREADFIDQAPESWDIGHRRNWAQLQASVLEVVRLKKALRQAIEQAEKQEPVAYAAVINGEIDWNADYPFSNEPFTCFDDENAVPLYTSPPRNQWVGLTDDEIWLKTRDINRDEKGWGIKFARAIEAKLKEKNT